MYFEDQKIKLMNQCEKTKNAIDDLMIVLKKEIDGQFENHIQQLENHANQQVYNFDHYK